MKTKMKSKILAIAIPFAVALFLMPLMAEKVTAMESYTDTKGIEYRLEYGEASVVAFQNSNLSGEITIPPTITYKGIIFTVTRIEAYAFKECLEITGITIPSTVTTLGEDAFAVVGLLASITVDARNPNYSSGDGVLYDKAKTTLITCPVGKTGEIDVPASVTTIEKNACHGTQLQKISFSQDSKLTTIKERAFNWCDKLTSINIPSSVTSIGKGAFYTCKSLESITIPPNVTNIEEDTFYYCASLRDITIPSSVNSIGGYAFGSCSNLTKISIPSSVNSIGESAFGACSNLTKISIPSSVNSIGEAAFVNCRNLTKISIPCDFDKNIFSNSRVIPSQSDDTFMISNTGTTGTFEYIHDTLTSHDGKAPTCTEDGTLKYWSCVKCNRIFSDSQGTNELTDTTDPATGHKYGAWTRLNATQHQKVCQHDKSHVVKENHKWDAGKVTKKATEKQAGIKTYTCTVCKATKTETIPKLKPTAPKTSGTPLARATVKKNSMTIGWNKIQGAKGYDVFFALCNHGKKDIKCKKVKTIKGNKTFKWTKSGLKKGTAYKFYVRAYVTKNGKKTYVSKTPMFHAYTGNGTKNYTSAKSVTVNKTKVTLKKGKTFKIKAKVIKVNKKKKLMPKSHAPALRYMTTNKKVATVNSSGKITAKGKGTCIIYAYAHNGVYKQIKVTVK